MSWRVFLLLLIGLMLSVCASAQDSSSHPDDPWEGFNRKVYSFNDALDHAFVIPMTTGYQAVAPEFVEAGVNNFFSNIGDIGTALNNLLQFKFADASSDIGRVLVNSTVGILGLFDVASRMGLKKHDEDFGQTLGHWGVGSGPYVVLLFFGPSNLRDGPGKVVDMVVWSASLPDTTDSEQIGLFALNVVSDRGKLMKLEEKTEELSRDRYVFIRDAYLDHREFLVQDGRGPLDDELYEGLEDK